MKQVENMSVSVISYDYTIDEDRWSKMSIFDQMGNIYSEVGRSFKARHANDPDSRDAAISRVINLFDVTARVLIKRRSPKAKEVLMAKEEYLNVMYGTYNQAKADSLENYFAQFAIAARLNR